MGSSDGMFSSVSRLDLFHATLCDKVCQWLVVGHWLSHGTHVLSSFKTDLHDITEMLLKVSIILTLLTLSQKNNDF